MKKLDITKLSTIGSLWQKYGANRFYFNLESADEMYRNLETAEHGALVLNRRERANGKVWIDLETMEFNSKGIDNPDEVISQFVELINVLCPEETEATAEENQGDIRMVKYKIVYKALSEIDSIDCDCETLGECKEYVHDTLEDWLFRAYKECDPEENPAEWNEMMRSYRIWVEKLNPETGEYKKCWSPSRKELESIGWVEEPEPTELTDPSEIIAAVDSIEEQAFNFRNNYFFAPPHGESARRKYEEEQSRPAIKWAENGHVYMAKFIVNCTHGDVRAKSIYTKDGKKTTLVAIRNSIKRIKAAEEEKQQ